ncbi:c-type cytochrome biogenesis protein CcmI [Variovorax sp. dw_954]|uniref:c-type cytochrome biogenesis protein CcmI n=1 Tax=unclassified Variovorax TaxID=663243 RepID=UPI001BD24FFF
MIALWLAVVALIALALALVLPPLFRSTGTADITRQALARCVYADQLAQLGRDLDAQALNAGDRAQAIEELQRQWLEEAAQPAAATRPARPWMAWGVALGLSLALPAAALLLYQRVGNPRAAAALAAGPAGAHERSGQDLEQMVAGLAARLQAHPADLEGWIVLARSYEVLQRYDDAVLAYRKAIELAPGQPQLLADYADALGSTRQGDLGGPAQEAIDDALAIDPQHPKALALAGMAAYQRGDTAQARVRWEAVRGLLPQDSEALRDIEANLAQLDPPKASTDPPVAAHVGGTVSIASTLRDRVPPQATVFVLARAPSAGRMPLAVLRLSAKDLPARFVLDDSMAMSPDRPLSRFSPLTIEVRVSISGQASPQQGDLYGAVRDVALGQDNLALLADEQVK